MSQHQWIFVKYVTFKALSPSRSDAIDMNCNFIHLSSNSRAKNISEEFLKLSLRLRGLLFNLPPHTMYVWCKYFFLRVLLQIYLYHHFILLYYCFSIVWRSGGIGVLRLGAWVVNRHRCAQQVSAIWWTLGCYWQRRGKHADPANCWRLAGPWKQLLHTHKNNNIKMQVML